MKPTVPVIKKLLGLLSHGLSMGLGRPEPGKMCIMAVYNAALGRPHSDSGLTDCVGTAVRSFDISLNDSRWSSNAARAAGMRREAVAKFGSNTVDQMKFAELVALGAVRVIAPIALRLAAKLNPKFADRLENHAVRCESVKTLAEAKTEGYAASTSAQRIAGYTVAYANPAANATANAAAGATAYAADAANNAADPAAPATHFAARAAARAADACATDEALGKMAEIATQALIELNSPGCKFLYLCD